MWSAMLSFGGWVTFWVLLLLYVRWTALERDFFAGQAVEDWRPEFSAEPLMGKEGQSTRLERLARVASLWRPA